MIYVLRNVVIAINANKFIILQQKLHLHFLKDSEEQLPAKFQRGALDLVFYCQLNA